MTRPPPRPLQCVSGGWPVTLLRLLTVVAVCLAGFGEGALSSDGPEWDTQSPSEIEGPGGGAVVAKEPYTDHLALPDTELPSLWMDEEESQRVLVVKRKSHSKKARKAMIGRASPLPPRKRGRRRPKTGPRTPRPPGPFPSPFNPPPYTAPQPTGQIFKFSDYGAVADGKTNTAVAWAKIWKAACGYTKGTGKWATIYIGPPGTTYFIGPTGKKGVGGSKGRLCSRITLQIDSTLKAPPRSQLWNTAKQPKAWLQVQYVSNVALTSSGVGIIDCNGNEWWPFPVRPKCIFISRSNNFLVERLEIRNSMGIHVFTDFSQNTTFRQLKLRTDPNANNTDGIHIRQANDVLVHNVDVIGGDDCVVLQGPTIERALVQNVLCGAGTHGMSIGSLGSKDGKTLSCISDVLFRDSACVNSDLCVRIKAWPQSKGSVRNVLFKNIKFKNVSSPLAVNMVYCPPGGCALKNQRLALWNVGFVNISGDGDGGIGRVIGGFGGDVGWNLTCTSSFPCAGVYMGNINSRPNNADVFTPDCRSVYGLAENIFPALPTAGCLQNLGAQPTSLKVTGQAYAKACSATAKYAPDPFWWKTYKFPFLKSFPRV